MLTAAFKTIMVYLTTKHFSSIAETIHRPWLVQGQTARDDADHKDTTDALKAKYGGQITGQMHIIKKLQCGYHGASTHTAQQHNNQSTKLTD